MLVHSVGLRSFLLKKIHNKFSICNIKDFKKYSLKTSEYLNIFVYCSAKFVCFAAEFTVERIYSRILCGSTLP